MRRVSPISHPTVKRERIPLRREARASLRKRIETSAQRGPRLSERDTSAQRGLPALGGERDEAQRSLPGLRREERMMRREPPSLPPYYASLYTTLPYHPVHHPVPPWVYHHPQHTARRSARRPVAEQCGLTEPWAQSGRIAWVRCLSCSREQESVTFGIHSARGCSALSASKNG